MVSVCVVEQSDFSCDLEVEGGCGDLQKMAACDPSCQDSSCMVSCVSCMPLSLLVFSSQRDSVVAKDRFFNSPLQKLISLRYPPQQRPPKLL